MKNCGRGMPSMRGRGLRPQGSLRIWEGGSLSSPRHKFATHVENVLFWWCLSIVMSPERLFYSTFWLNWYYPIKGMNEIRNTSLFPWRVESFQVKRALTERLRRSAIPHMQRLLNEENGKQRDICRQISDYKPVNNDLFVNLYHWDIKNFHYYFIIF